MDGICGKDGRGENCFKGASLSRKRPMDRQYRARYAGFGFRGKMNRKLIGMNGEEWLSLWGLEHNVASD